jgi:hypothetical protein
MYLLYRPNSYTFLLSTTHPICTPYPICAGGKIEKNEMGGGHVARMGVGRGGMGRGEVGTGFVWGNLRER